MNGQWTWQSTPTGPRAALEDCAPTYVFKKKRVATVHSPSIWGAGDRVSTLVAMALSKFSMKKNPALLLSSNKCSQNPLQNKRFSAKPQGDGNRNRDTLLHSQKTMLKNLKTKYKRSNNIAIMHQSFSRCLRLGRAKKKNNDRGWTIQSTTGACHKNRQRNKLFLTLQSDSSPVTWEANADEELSIQGVGAVRIWPITEQDKHICCNLRPQ